mgnify:CR=1 FL=1|jgi:CRISPR-associated protein Cas2
MRQSYIVTYDVRDPKRLRKVYRLMRGYGRHIQLSVFYCDLDRMRRIELETRIGGEIHYGEDQVLFIDIGPTEGRALDSISSVGRPYIAGERRAVIA